jgi:acyl-CoA synthetase (AMP-forming)/AMP-acid ligase II
MILTELLSKSLADHPDSIVGSLAGHTNYRDLRSVMDEKHRALAAALGARSDDRARVAIIRKNAPAYVSDLLAVLADGGVPFLMDPALGAAEIAALHRDCGFDAILHDESPPLPPTDRTATCATTQLWLPPRRNLSRSPLHPTTEVCRLTSGSTRSPACIEFSGAAVVAAAQGWCSASDLGVADRILCFAGLYNGLAFNTSLIPGLICGASLFIPSGLPSPSNVERHLDAIDPTVLVAFPVAYDHLAASRVERPPHDRLRLALSSAAPLSAKTSATVAERLIPIADYYGIAETGPLTFNSAPVPGGGQGYLLPGVSIRIESAEDGVGVLLAKSSSMGTKYLNHPGQFESRITADGYYRTTDRGSLTSDGELHLAGRLARSFNIGGRKISSQEVEDLLTSHPAVAAGAVAVVTPEGGRPFLGALAVRTADLDAVELRRYCLARAAPFKVPERIVFVEALPVSGTGKVQAAAVEQVLLGGHFQQGSIT